MKTNPSTKDSTAGSFRPSSYWEESDPLNTILRNIKGTNRRRMVTDFWNEGKLDDLNEALLNDDTDPKLKLFLESIDPTFMGGEYLPDCLPTEVEIARVELESTTADVISIRARRLSSDNLIHYRVVDEYNTTFEIEPESSPAPLTHDELIQFIGNTYFGENSDLALGYNQMNFECGGDAESLRHFTTVSSSFYPGLYDHYETVFEQWVEENS